ncbi:ATP-grasp domain-containing protein [Pseudoalteromonas tetraodonis]|uniref:hypothetical protein n=1 Tax=Pseudoalteromonas tetraodonis TaxID=43659 RepID=UPI0037364859
MKVYFVTWPNGFFGSAGASWKQLDIELLSKKISSKFEVEVVSINKILSCELKKQDIVIYNSSENREMRDYIKDVIYLVSKKANIVPSFDSLMAHESKGFQQLFRQEMYFGNLNGQYCVDLDDVHQKEPFVLKLVEGAGSSQVHLIKGNKDIHSIRRKYFKDSLVRKIKNIIRSTKLNKKQLDIYLYKYKAFTRIVTQDFIPGLESDYKVLVFGNKYYVLNRKVKKNDFRASGSGILNFIEPPMAVLDFAKSVFFKLDEPYASLDIAMSNEGCHLIEYQVLNFGPYTLVNSPGFYTENNGDWKFHKKTSELENEFSEALYEHIIDRF